MTYLDAFESWDLKLSKEKQEFENPSRNKEVMKKIVSWWKVCASFLTWFSGHNVLLQSHRLTFLDVFKSWDAKLSEDKKSSKIHPGTKKLWTKLYLGGKFGSLFLLSFRVITFCWKGPEWLSWRHYKAEISSFQRKKEFKNPSRNKEVMNKIVSWWKVCASFLTWFLGHNFLLES